MGEHEQPRVRAIDWMLLDAIESRQADRIASALRAGANPKLDVDGYPVLCIAALQGNVPAVDELLKHGAYPNASDEELHRSPLMYVAMGGSTQNHMRVLELLLAGGGSPKIHDESYRTALDWAALFLNRPVADRLHALKVECNRGAAAWLARSQSAGERSPGA